jgi:hypothetical protein
MATGFRITESGLAVGSVIFPVSFPPERFADLMETPPIIFPTNPEAPEWKETWCFEGRGICLLTQKSQNRVSTVTFVFVTEEIHFGVKQHFRELLEINGERITEALLEESLTEQGAYQFKRWAAGHYSASFGPYAVSLAFHRPRDPRGKRKGRRRLSYVQFSYSAADLPEVEVQSDLRRA